MLKPDIFYVDSAEKNTENWPVRDAAIKFFSNLGYEVVVASLFVGDYIFNNMVFERKIVTDFVKSIQDNHLQNQAVRMTENFAYRYVLIEGSKTEYIYSDDNFGKRRFSEKQFAGSIASLEMNYDVSVLSDYETYIDLFYQIHKLIEKSNRTKKIDVNHLFTKRRDIYAENILMCTHGISKTKAQALLKYYTVDEIRHGSADEIAKNIKGVGPATVSKIQEDLKKMATHKFVEDMI